MSFHWTWRLPRKAKTQVPIQALPQTRQAPRQPPWLSEAEGPLSKLGGELAPTSQSLLTSVQGPVKLLTLRP